MDVNLCSIVNDVVVILRSVELLMSIDVVE